MTKNMIPAYTFIVFCYTEDDPTYCEPICFKRMNWFFSAAEAQAYAEECEAEFGCLTQIMVPLSDKDRDAMIKNSQISND